MSEKDENTEAEDQTDEEECDGNCDGCENCCGEELTPEEVAAAEAEQAKQVAAIPWEKTEAGIAKILGLTLAFRGNQGFSKLVTDNTDLHKIKIEPDLIYIQQFKRWIIQIQITGKMEIIEGPMAEIGARLFIPDRVKIVTITDVAGKKDKTSISLLMTMAQNGLTAMAIDLGNPGKCFPFDPAAGDRILNPSEVDMPAETPVSGASTPPAGQAANNTEQPTTETKAEQPSGHQKVTKFKFGRKPAE